MVDAVSLSSPPLLPSLFLEQESLVDGDERPLCSSVA